MFEKEAEERAEEIEAKQTLGIYDNDEDLARDEGWNDGYVSGYEDGFKDGAEFGYNKANEWHFVKDGDLPKDSCVVYYKDSLGELSWSVVHPSWYIAGIEAFFKNNPQIIAWKEIVLPELKESEK